VSDVRPPPGFLIGHHTDDQGRTGCRAIIAPPASRGGVDVRGGAPGTRETDAVSVSSRTNQVTAVLLSGGSAFGLAAADGVVRWCEEQGRGFPTSVGPVPVVPAAIIFDLGVGDPSARPGPDAGYAACEAAVEAVPETGAVGAGTGATAGKVLGMERCAHGGLGYAAVMTGAGATVAAVAVANPVGDVIAADGSLLAAPRGDDGEFLRTTELVAAMAGPPDWGGFQGRNSTLVCVMTDASLDKVGCSRVARMASSGLARAIEPIYSDFDGDTVFCVSSGDGQTDQFTPFAVGTAAAQVTAEALRAAVS
jgi:L-aminopeptidase/D-esterase-like protein